MGRGRLFLLAGLAGSAAALGHAPFGLWPLSLIGFAALAWLVAHQGRGALAGWGGGFGYFAVTLTWIVEPFLVDAALHGWMAPFALVLMAGGLALFWGLAGWLSALIGGNRALGWALCLAAAEMVRGHVLTGFPWALPAYIWADTWILALSAIVGAYGVTAVTLILASLMSDLPRRWPVVLLAVVGLTGAGAYRQGLEPETSSLGTVRLVQPNAPQHEKWDPERAQVFVDRAIGFTARPKENVSLVVWPESAVPYPLDLAAAPLSEASAAAGGSTLITGINRRTPEGQWFNALVVVGENGLVEDIYDKVHLVPFGEYIPLRIDLLRSLAGFSGFGFSPGSGVRLIETPLGRALPLICYEAIFPGHGSGVEDRPDYLLQITNDAWFGTFSGPYQHLDQARFRAVEQGISLIRAANTGVSAVIDPYGRVVGFLPLGEEGYIDAAVPAPAPPTLYSRTGDLPVAVFLVFAMSALCVAARRNAIANR